MEPDGAISAYRWVDRELLEEWIDFCMAADPDQVRLLFANGRFAIKTEAGKSHMIGSYDREEIRCRDEQTAVYCVTSASWHGEERKETQYLISAAVLPEIGDLVRKNRLRRWSRERILKSLLRTEPLTATVFPLARTSFRSRPNPIPKITPCTRSASGDRQKIHR